MIIILNKIYILSKFISVFSVLSLALMLLYLFYFKFLYKGKDLKKTDEFKSLKRLFISVTISLFISLSIFLILSRPITLLKVFDIDDLNDVTHFKVNLWYDNELLNLDSFESLNNLSKENRLEFLNLIKNFKVKRSSINDVNTLNSKDYPLTFITLYQNKYKTDGKYRRLTFTNLGLLEIENSAYELINYADLQYKIKEFILEKNN